jgi:LytS/YehU family sensor histidine kinase
VLELHRCRLWLPDAVDSRIISRMRWEAVVSAEAGLTGLAALFVYLLLRRQRRGFGTLEQRATLRTLAFATTALSILRRGLSGSSASKVLPSVAEQAGAAAVALYDEHGVLDYHPAAGSCRGAAEAGAAAPPSAVCRHDARTAPRV